MKALATLLRPGLQTTIQDAGRSGLRHLGVPLSGAADALSYALANAAAGAPPGAPALECAITGPGLRFEQDIAFAIGGADMRPTLNDSPAPLYEPIIAKRGDILRLAAAAVGARAYIAFNKGVAGDRFLGSAATYLPGAFGGRQGRALQTGDTLYSAELEPAQTAAIPYALHPVLAHDFVLRATQGPEAAARGVENAHRFFAIPYTADRRADRMGVRLLSAAQSANPPARMASGPVFPGTVQYPPDGAPFLLLADAQTVGGYPRIAQVIASDMHLAAQIRPGDRVWFRQVSPAEARNINIRRAALLQSVLPEFSFD